MTQRTTSETTITTIDVRELRRLKLLRDIYLRREAQLRRELAANSATLLDVQERMHKNLSDQGAAVEFYREFLNGEGLTAEDWQTRRAQ